MNHSPLTRRIMRKYYNGCEENLASSISWASHTSDSDSSYWKKGEKQKYTDVIFPLFCHWKLL